MNTYANIKNEIGDEKILAVSKLQPEEKIISLYNQGQRAFGENYVQEALGKIESLSAYTDISWHLIGHLQKNKIKYIIGKFKLIHSIDSFSLAESLSKQCVAKNTVQNILIQVNIASEDSKGGFSIEDLEKNWPELCKLPNISIHGLMTMPPLSIDGENVRPYFRALKELLTKLKSKTETHLHPMNTLSMGTSSDYKVAIEEGATLVRLGTVLFGARN